MKKILATLLLFSLPLLADPLSKSEEHLLKQISKGFSAVAKTATPAVVYLESEIEAKKPSAHHSPRSSNPFDYFGNDDFLSQFFGFPHKKQPVSRRETARGTGFLISSDGYIITNNHLIDKCTKVKVTLHDGKILPATVIGSDPKTDLAVLKIEGKKFPYLEFGDSDALEVGDWLIAIGNPFGLQASVTVGVVSAKGRNDLQIADFEDFIQTDAAINPGNSGGPSLTVEGKVIGVNTAIASASGGYMGIGFAIPSNMVQQIMKQLIDNGTVTRGYLGVSLQPLDQDLADFYKIDCNQGALVADILPDSPAERAGLKQEDVIIGFNGTKVENLPSFRNAVSLMTPGSKLKLKVIRNETIKELTVTIEALPEECFGPSAPLDKLGIQVQPLTPEIATKLGTLQKEGVVITAIEPASPAAIAGMAPGCIVVAVNRKPIATVEEFNKAINQAADDGRVLLKVIQGEMVRFIALHFD
ncbi:MAG: Periplasmic serine endoprotease DegP [Chlamydiales bacterium]|nr:Periplasmic serine endoprotease DegP [Chlamydiales bacterium]MCH9620556.1 Periplasmic serine endoprotease DegP [Chlamydiales bacterium]MCH9622996.1 Periplasmic serine endoprotease DegP [Chlamydiales bacterium]